jgi:hypothetical protein
MEVGLRDGFCVRQYAFGVDAAVKTPECAGLTEPQIAAFGADRDDGVSDKSGVCRLPLDDIEERSARIGCSQR